MKKLIKKIAEYFGYEISPKKEIHFEERFSTALECSLLSLLSCNQEILIVQVGANDGSINDPIYEFVKYFSERTQILLIEPQKELIPYLQENYLFHNNCLIFNGAIGPTKELILYSVDKSVWNDLDVHYAKEWPEYRAPTGVTSTRKEHVKDWLRMYLNKNFNIESAIREYTVPGIQLSALLKDMNIPQSIDVLQIDAEGYDDQVIYYSNIDKLTPKVINFEAEYLSSERLERIRLFLEKRGYYLSWHDGDILAILTH